MYRYASKLANHLGVMSMSRKNDDVCSPSIFSGMPRASERADEMDFSIEIYGGLALCVRVAYRCLNLVSYFKNTIASEAQYAFLYSLFRIVNVH